ncbi:cystatin-like protein [Clarias gariepinus]|uniref:cystatin-like protein n=1 Tax=Clarias gariepinus TaxID=13013 RepID=UPI00234E065B|nr:cystatin-like protein [Clarias gariepinus]
MDVVALKLLLLAALTLLVSAQTPTDYRDLSKTLQKHVDKALEEGNRKFGRNHHVDFHSIVKTPVTRQSSLNVNVLLKVTTCKKAHHSFKNRPECNTQKKNTPLIDCLVCKMKSGKELVHCAEKIEVIKGKHKEIRNTCQSYYIGVSIMMSSPMQNINKLGCRACI